MTSVFQSLCQLQRSEMFIATMLTISRQLRQERNVAVAASLTNFALLTELTERREGATTYKHCVPNGTVIMLVVSVMITFASFTLASAQKKSSCIECHSNLDDPRLSAPAKLFDNDIHRARGLSWPRNSKWESGEREDSKVPLGTESL